MLSKLEVRGKARNFTKYIKKFLFNQYGRITDFNYSKSLEGTIPVAGRAIATFAPMVATTL